MFACSHQESASLAEESLSEANQALREGERRSARAEAAYKEARERLDGEVSWARSCSYGHR